MTGNSVDILEPFLPSQAHHISSQATEGLNPTYWPGGIIVKKEEVIAERNKLLLWAQKVQKHLEIQGFTDPDVPTACLRIPLCPTQGHDLGIAGLTELAELFGAN